MFDDGDDGMVVALKNVSEEVQWREVVAVTVAKGRGMGGWKVGENGRES